MAAGLIGGQNDLRNQGVPGQGGRGAEQILAVQMALLGTEQRRNILDGGLADARPVSLPSLLPVQEPAAAEGDTDAWADILDSGDALGAVSYTPYVTNSIEAIICARFDSCDYWIAVAWCESTLRPYAIGYAGQYVGLYQVWLGHGYGYDWLLDPANNTLAAWELSKEGAVTSLWPWCQYQ